VTESAEGEWGEQRQCKAVSREAQNIRTKRVFPTRRYSSVFPQNSVTEAERQGDFINGGRVTPRAVCQRAEKPA